MAWTIRKKEPSRRRRLSVALVRMVLRAAGESIDRPKRVERELLRRLKNRRAHDAAT